MNYRPEIDGLRAIAVAPVILFHAGSPLFSGGFVGVDVFFVISGYLITTLLLNEIGSDTFSFARFYERRARRLAPALIVVMLACFPFAWVWMLPSQFKEFAGSAFSVGVFLSNFYFLSEVEYFRPSSELQPLLHTWSLSIEEQYYLLFPAFLVLAMKLGRRAVIGMIMVFVLGGIYLAHVGVTDDPGKNYYHSAARLWEIGAGSLLAFLPVRQAHTRDDLVAALGLAMIAAAIVFFDKTTPFPSLWTLMPVVGTLLLLRFAAASNHLGRMLAWRPLVGLGLISYSAYLWHQPLFAFARLRSPEALGLPALSGLIVLTLVLAWLSWRFVEQPFRGGKGQLILARRPFMISALGGTAVLAAAGLWVYALDGLPERHQNGVYLAGLDARLRPNFGLSPKCEGEFSNSPECVTSQMPRLLVWGDSYAMHLVPGIVAAHPDVEMRQHTRSSCSPIVGLTFADRAIGFSQTEDCAVFNAAVVEEFRQYGQYETVILSSPFPFKTRALWTDDGQLVEAADVLRLLGEGLSNTIDLINASGADVILVTPPPATGHDLGNCAAKVLRFGATETTCDFAPSEITNTAVFDMLDSLNHKARIIHLSDTICASGMCDTLQGDTLIYRDRGHLSVEGSRAIKQAFGDLLPAAPEGQ